MIRLTDQKKLILKIIIRMSMIQIMNILIQIMILYLSLKKHHNWALGRKNFCKGYNFENS